MVLRCAEMIGRESEVSGLRDAIGGVWESGRTVLITGPAGIGKTRLAREAMGIARERGLECFLGRSVPTGAPVPLRPLIEIALGISRRGLLPPIEDLGSYGPPLGRIVTEWAPSHPLHQEAINAPVLGEAVLRLMRAVAPGGCLFVVEDLHWADAETMSVMEYLRDHIADAPMVLLATCRGDGPADTYGENVHHIPVGRLHHDEVEAMLDACAADERVRAAARLADGVPLVVEEMLSAAASGHVPRTFADSVRTRLRACPARQRRVLTAAALLGQSFDDDLVRCALGMCEDDVREALDAGRATGLLEHGSNSFRHALTLDAVLAGTPAQESAAIAADLLAAVRRRDPELPGGLCVLAADLAERSGDRDGAARHLTCAAERAVHSGSLRSASTLLEHGLRLDPSPPLWSELAELLAATYGRAGRIDDAAAMTRRLLAAPHLDDPDGAVRTRVRLRLAQAAADGNLWDVAEAELLRIGPCAVGGAADGKALVESRILLGRGRAAEAAALAQRVARSALERQPDVAAAAEEVVGRVARLSDPEKALAAFGRAHVIAVRHRLPLAELSALHELGTIDMFTTGRLDRLLRARRRAVDAGAILTTAMIDLQLVPAYFMHGAAEQARDAATRAIVQSGEAGLDAMRSRVTSFLPHTSALRGDRAAVERDIALIDPSYLAADPDAESGVWGTARGVCSLLREERAGAVAEMETAARYGLRSVDVSPHIWWGYWAVLRAVEGKPDAEVEEAVAALRACPAVVNRQNAAAARLAEAVLIGRSGGGAEATRIVEEHGERLMPWAWQRHLSRRLVAEAALKDGWGDPRRWLTEAAAYFDEFGAPAVAAVSRMLAESSPRADLRQNVLTPREREVLRLMGDGLTNVELARLLSISPRTVEKHVASLCHKLDADGRGQLIALAARP